MSAKWEALLRCRRHRTAVQHLRSDLQVGMHCNTQTVALNDCLVARSMSMLTMP